MSKNTHRPIISIWLTYSLLFVGLKYSGIASCSWWVIMGMIVAPFFMGAFLIVLDVLIENIRDLIK